MLHNTYNDKYNAYKKIEESLKLIFPNNSIELTITMGSKIYIDSISIVLDGFRLMGFTLTEHDIYRVIGDDISKFDEYVIKVTSESILNALEYRKSVYIPTCFL